MRFWSRTRARGGMRRNHSVLKSRQTLSERVERISATPQICTMSELSMNKTWMETPSSQISELIPFRCSIWGEKKPSMFLNKQQSSACDFCWLMMSYFCLTALMENVQRTFPRRPGRLWVFSGLELSCSWTSNLFPLGSLCTFHVLNVLLYTQGEPVRDEICGPAVHGVFHRPLLVLGVTSYCCSVSSEFQEALGTHADSGAWRNGRKAECPKECCED